MLVDYDDIRGNIDDNDVMLLKKQVYDNCYIPRDMRPFYEQALIMLDEMQDKSPKNRLIAGGAYSGKSQFVAFDVCRFLMFPEYRALLLRNTFPQITSSGEVVDKLQEWLCDEERLGEYVCRHNKVKHYFEAPSGAQIHYGSCDNEKQMDKYRGTSFNRIYIIEASEINGIVLDFMNRSVRSPTGSGSLIQEMYMLVTNPSFGPGVEYIKKNFIDEDSPFKYYNIDLMMNDKVDRLKYDERLAMMSPKQQAFMRYGDWDFVASEGLLLGIDDLEGALLDYGHELYEDIAYSVISIDAAGDGQDYTSMTHMFLLHDGRVIIDDNILLSDSVIEEAMIDFVARQKNKYPLDKVILEQEGGSSPVYAMRHFDNTLARIQDEYYFDVELIPVTGKGGKFKRANPLAYGIRRGIVYINKAIPNRQQLFNQFMYITPIEKEMKELPSPDFLDSCTLGYNFMIEELDVEEYYTYNKSIEERA